MRTALIDRSLKTCTHFHPLLLFDRLAPLSCCNRCCESVLRKRKQGCRLHALMFGSWAFASPPERSSLPPLHLLSGAFVGFAWESSLVAVCPDVNQRFYGAPVSATDLLFGRVAPPRAAEPLYAALHHLYTSFDDAVGSGSAEEAMPESPPPPTYDDCRDLGPSFFAGELCSTRIRGWVIVRLLLPLLCDLACSGKCSRVCRLVPADHPSWRTQET